MDTGHDDALYARGFLLGPPGLLPPRPDWVRMQIGRLVLWRDPRLEVHAAAGEKGQVCILGHVFDIRRPAHAPQSLVEEAANLDLDAMLARSDGWSGRFVIVRVEVGSILIAADAAATRSVFYAPTAPDIAASHASLVAKVIGDTPRPGVEAQLARRGMYGLPGDATLWKHVHILTPNQLLDVATGGLTRFWPRAGLPVYSVDEAADKVAAMLRATARGLAHARDDLLFSLTAGLDSRTMLSACREFRDRFHYFTYSNGNHHLVDVDFGTAAAKRLDLRHIVLPTHEALPRQLRELMFLNAPRPHFWRGAYAYLRHFPPRALHLRSSLGEVGRCFYRDPNRCFPLQRARDLAKGWCGMPENREHDEAAFAEWAERVGFWRVEGMNRFDLFNWEHRMGAWLSGIAAESDIAMDTHVAYNCREILEALLAVPVQARHDGSVFLEVIRLNWPQLLDMPINGRHVPRDAVAVSY
ncbi:hypothetical protein [Pseudoxanthomonas sp. PXM02]|uniref:hypothetical protein n=1 Tax=Pseudoxanthomonas sp. PXM02 TaxID=2769294 RepID=UPI00177ECAAB|nr:hypothetical protein [Pseudoxanthomonas sp. PXM02]MBD9480028.1 hypothetical protein [Pseudoxanthomonas sp. PXM02]